MGVFFTFLKLYKWYQIAKRIAITVSITMVITLVETIFHIIDCPHIQCKLYRFLNVMKLQGFCLIGQWVNNCTVVPGICYL